MSTVSGTLPSTFGRSAYTILSCVLAAAVGIALLGFAQPGVKHMAAVWRDSEEYSHALLIPLIAAYLIWQLRGALLTSGIVGSWYGVTIVLVGVAVQGIGSLSAVYALQQYGLFISVYGLIGALLGMRTLRIIWAPLVMLLLMVPLPEFLLQNVSGHLQLISSQIGVAFIRLFGISVFVEGNVIDLGVYKLQVAEACDGLRYLFPLMTVGFIMAYMFQAATWKRVALFLSTIPVTILMNSIRIGSIGVMVEHWGVSMAEGFLHEFQGWAVFMVSAAFLLLEMILLSRVGAQQKHWREVFGLVSASNAGVEIQDSLRAPKPFAVAAVLVVLFGAVAVMAPERTEAFPTRDSFTSFPNRIEEWDGRRSAMEQIYIDALKLDDYVMVDYARNEREVVNLYVAWYQSQRGGQSAHSPRSCLPGGGWHISDLRQVSVPVTVGDQPLRVNRVQIELGTQKQLVYYWFQQRGRIITNEYLVKWYLFWDSLTRRRSDGALVRLVTPVRIGESMGAADSRLTEMAAETAARLDRYVPN